MVVAESALGRVGPVASHRNLLVEARCTISGTSSGVSPPRGPAPRVCRPLVVNEKSSYAPTVVPTIWSG